MQRTRFPRALGRILLLVALVVGLLPAVAAVPAAANVPDGHSYTLTTAPVTITRKSQKFQMSLYVSVWGSQSRHLSVELSQTRDPSGVTKSTQTHRYSFDLGKTGSFTAGKNLSSAELKSGTDMGGYGSTGLTFAADQKQKVLCKNGSGVHQAQRAGALKGKFRLKTGTKLFGDITERPGRATLLWDDGQPCGDMDWTFPCFPAGQSMMADRNSDQFSIWVNKVNGSKSASINAYWWESAGKKSFGGSKSHSVWATVPAKHVTIASDLKTATIQGRKGTWLSGVAKFASNGAVQEWPGTCGKPEKTYKNFSRQGILKAGNTPFKVTSWLGAGKSVGTSKMPAAARRSTAAK